MRKQPITEFGKWLNRKMFENDYTCEDIAKILKTTRQTIQNHKIGTNDPSYVFVIAYCLIFDEDPDEIWKLV